jgi:hypothetical protein
MRMSPHARPPARPRMRHRARPQVGAAAAFAVSGFVDWGRVLSLVLGAVFVIAWLNLRWVTQCDAAQSPGAPARISRRVGGGRGGGESQGRRAARRARGGLRRARTLWRGRRGFLGRAGGRRRRSAAASVGPHQHTATIGGDSSIAQSTTIRFAPTPNLSNPDPTPTPTPTPAHLHTHTHSNDAFDASTGVDKNKAESVVNLTGSAGRVLAAATVFLGAGLGLLGGSLGAAHAPHAVNMLLAAVACGYVYQGPPFRQVKPLGCRGLLLQKRGCCAGRAGLGGAWRGGALQGGAGRGKAGPQCVAGQAYLSSEGACGSHPASQLGRHGRQARHPPCELFHKTAVFDHPPPPRDTHTHTHTHTPTG